MNIIWLDMHCICMYVKWDCTKWRISVDMHQICFNCTKSELWMNIHSLRMHIKWLDMHHICMYVKWDTRLCMSKEYWCIFTQEFIKHIERSFFLQYAWNILKMSHLTYMHYQIISIDFMLQISVKYQLIFINNSRLFQLGKGSLVALGYDRRIYDSGLDFR